MIEQLAETQSYEDYKDSGVEWLGEIPAHWKSISLKFLLKEKLKYGANETGVEYRPELPRYIRITDFSENGRLDEVSKLSLRWDVGKNYLLCDGDILFARSGATVGKSYQFKQSMSEEGHCAFAGYLIKATPDTKKITSDYLKFYSNSGCFKGWKESIFNKATIENIGADKYSQLTVVVPPIKEQALIAAYLDCKTAQIDQAIAIKEQQIALLKERKQILIQNAVTRGVDPNVPMRDSGMEWIGEIPEHWGLYRVKNVFRLVIESAEKNNDHELLSIYTDIGVKPRKELEEKGNKASTTDGYWLVKKGDFIVNKLLAWMGAIGLSEYEGVTSPAYDILRPIKPIDGYFYHYLFRTKSCTSELKKHSRGIMEMRLRLYFDKFGNVVIPYPSHEEQSAIVIHIETQSAKIDQAIAIQQQQIDKLKEYKATLINSAVTGKIKVTELGECKDVG